MAGRGDELNTRLTATDQASATVDKLADKVGDLEDKPHDVDLDADTSEADAKVRALDERLDDLTDDKKVMILEAQAKDAQRVIDQVNRDLARAHRLGDDEIQLKLDARGDAEEKLKAVNREIAEIEEGSQEANGWLARIGERLDLKSRFNGLGASAGKAMAAGFAAVGVGALLVESVQRSWDAAGGMRRVTGAFRLSADEADRYSKIAGQLFADNWGESLTEVQQLVGTVGERLEGLTNRQLRSISAQIQATADTWGYGFEEIIRSVTQLVQNGLAPSVQATMDLIVTALQSGGNEAGDLLETIDEYSQHWAAMGLSGEEAMNQIIAGLQQGQRDTDKVADAVKEMRIRVVEDTDAISEAYRDIGLNADVLRQRFLEGGDSARSAFDTVIAALRSVEDPIERNRLAIELIGTQFEDLGPTALEILATVEGALLKTEGAAQDLADTVGQVTPWERMKRQGESALLRLGNVVSTQVNKPFDQLNAGIDVVGSKLGILGGDAEESAGAIGRAGREAADSIMRIAESAVQAAGDVGGLTSETDQGAESWRLYREQAERVAEALNEQGLAGAAKGVADAFSAAREQLAEQGIYDNLLDQIARVAEAEAAIGEAAKESATDAEEAERRHRAALRSLQGSVLDLLESYDDIPAQKKTEIVAEILRGDLDEISSLLDDLTRDRYVNVHVVPAGTSTPSFKDVTFNVRAGTAPGVGQVTPTPQPAQPTYIDQRQTTVINPPGSPVQVAVDGGAFKRLFGERSPGL